jgi:hypothetical protein
LSKVMSTLAKSAFVGAAPNQNNDQQENTGGAA